MPAVGLLLACRFSGGWVSVASFVLLLAYVGLGWGYAVVAEARAWIEMEDAHYHRDD